MAALVIAASALLMGPVTPSVFAGPPEPADEPAPEVAFGEVAGATVAVAAPPVPPTSVVVAVGEPPVPPTSVVVAVGEPPVPPTTRVASSPPIEPAAAVNRLSRAVEPAHLRVSDAARQVTLGLLELSDLL